MFDKIINYIKNSRKELKKVSWPDKKTTSNYTLLVILISLFMAAFLALVDYILTMGVEKTIIR